MDQEPSGPDASARLAVRLLHVLSQPHRPPGYHAPHLRKARCGHSIPNGRAPSYLTRDGRELSMRPFRLTRAQPQRDLAVRKWRWVMANANVWQGTVVVFLMYRSQASFQVSQSALESQRQQRTKAGKGLNSRARMFPGEGTRWSHGRFLQVEWGTVNVGYGHNRTK